MLRPYTTRPRFPLLCPRHHGAQLGADLLDRMLRAGLAQRLEPAASAPALGDPLPREAAGLDIGQDALHRRANLRCHDLRAPGVIAVFRGVADRVPHEDRKSTRLNSSHLVISYAVFCLKKKKIR